MTSARDTNLLIGFKLLLRFYGPRDTMHEFLSLFLAGEKGEELEIVYKCSLLLCNSLLSNLQLCRYRSCVIANYLTNIVQLAKKLYVQFLLFFIAIICYQFD